MRPLTYSDPFGLRAGCDPPDSPKCTGVPIEKVTADIKIANAFLLLSAVGDLIEAGLAAADAASAARFVPNPGGRLGSAAHRATIAATADAIEADGGRIIAGGGRLAERAIDVGGGRIRFPDIAAVRADGTRVFVNVGRVTKTGKPVAREVRALKDLHGTGIETIFVPYKP